MVLIKALLAGMIGVSLCMADISGIVTDTGTAPISGAVVQLENGGQTATTGADGSFTLVVSTAILPGNKKLLPSGLSAGISGNMLTVAIAERSVVEVETYDLSGKALSTVRKTLDAGSHSISLPYRGTGIYLYKVKSGNRVFVLKGNSVCGTSSGGLVTSQGSLQNLLSKQSRSMAAINDAIAVTKAGYLNYRCVQYNLDTTGIQIKMIASAGTVSDTDGNVYQTVKIGNQVWTVENLRVTKFNDGSSIPLVTDSAAWRRIYDSSLTAPAYCFYNNTVNSDSIGRYGALYNWYIVSPTNPKKIAPTGWHVPTDTEWDTLQNYLIANGYNWDGTTTENKIGKSLAAKTDWVTYSTIGSIGCDLTKNNRSGFSALPGGYRSSYGGFNAQSYQGFWWSVTECGTNCVWHRLLSCHDECSWRGNHDDLDAFSVRLLRD
jgi:uncharacterized protein (TIGR02145 family)